MLMWHSQAVVHDLLQAMPASIQMVDNLALLSALDTAASRLICLEPQLGAYQPVGHDDCNYKVQKAISVCRHTGFDSHSRICSKQQLPSLLSASDSSSNPVFKSAQCMQTY